jgi:hypothetical protein
MAADRDWKLEYETQRARADASDKTAASLRAQLATERADVIAHGKRAGSFDTFDRWLLSIAAGDHVGASDP